MQENMKGTSQAGWKPKLKVKQANGLEKVVMTFGTLFANLKSALTVQEAADDKEMLEDLVLAAINAASEKPKKRPTKPWVHLPGSLPAGMGDFPLI